MSAVEAGVPEMNERGQPSRRRKSNAGGGDRMAEATLTKVKIQPLGDRVLVRPIEQKEVKRGGIIIPDTAKEKPQEGEVVAVGRGKTTDEGKTLAMDVKPGDRILYGKYSGNEIKIDDVEYLIMHQDDILGILK
jgi:chaperonin GroES